MFTALGTHCGINQIQLSDRIGTIEIFFQSGSIRVSEFLQTTITLRSRPRGFHLITGEIVEAIPQLGQFEAGLLHAFIQHTSAGLTVNENADPDVRVDLETAANQLCPESSPFVHTCEGPDDMPAHVKSSLFGSSVTIPIQDGRLALGTWQGIYLCEHRNRGGPRRLVLTVNGQRR